MGGKNKALQLLAGKPLLSHVIERLQKQCTSLSLSVEIPDSAWESFGLPQIADPQAGSNGPLGGLLAAMESTHRADEWLLLTPCDAPFLPSDLAQRLIQSAISAHAPAALVSWQQQWQPTFSIWHSSLLKTLHSAVWEQGQRGLKEFLLTIEHSVFEWPEQSVSPFFNINTPEDLALAESLLDRHPKAIS